VAVTPALLFLALGAPVAVWAIGGLEQPLYAALLAAAIPLVYSILESEVDRRGRLLALSAVLGLLCVTRPDGPLFAIAAGLTVLLVGWPRLGMGAIRDAGVVALGPMLCYGGQLAFRILYYGEVVPNTALVKITPSSTHWAGGIAYVRDGFLALAPMSTVGVAALIGLFFSTRRRGRAIHLLIVLSVWTAYVVFIGGDVFPAYRHLVPAMVVLAFALADGGAALVSRLGGRPLALLLVAGVSLSLVPSYRANQAADRHNLRALRERWEWDGRELGLLLKAAFATERPLLAVTAAGCLPYWSELPALDMLGLNDYYLPRHPPPDIGRGFLGHELGDGAYVLGREPDLIVFSIGSGPAYRSGDELNRMPEFHARYVPVLVNVRGLADTPIVYAHRYSRRIGVAISDTIAAVPGFLLTGDDTRAELHAGSKLVARIGAGSAANLTINLPAATDWIVSSVRSSDPGSLDAGLSVNGTALTISARAVGTTSAALEEIVLTRRSVAE
jgi:hypothetical protein